DFVRVAPPTGRGKNELDRPIVHVDHADILEVPAGTERAACAEEYRNRSFAVGIELEKRVGQGIRAFGIHGVTGLGPIMDDGPDRALLLGPHCHRSLLLLTICCWSSLFF